MGTPRRPQPSDVSVVMRGGPSQPGQVPQLPSNIPVNDPGSFLGQAPSVSGDQGWEDYTAPPEEWQDFTEPQQEEQPGFFGEFMKQQPIHPLALGQMVSEASKWLNQAVQAITIHGEFPPMPEAVKKLAIGQGKVGQEAIQAFQSGDIAGGIARTIYWLTPLLGQQLNEQVNIGQQSRARDESGQPTNDVLDAATSRPFRRGLGGTFGAMTAVAPMGAPAPTEAQVLGASTKPSLPSTARAAAQYADAEGIPLSVGDRTGIESLRHLEKAIDKTSLTAEQVVNNPMRAKQVEAMSAAGGRLADRVSPQSINREGAGLAAKDVTEQAAIDVGSSYAKSAESIAKRTAEKAQTEAQAAGSVRSSLQAKAEAHKAAADEAYGLLRSLEADPANIKTVRVRTSGTARGEPVSVAVPTEMGLPVDIAGLGVKDSLRGVLAELEAQWPLAQKEASPGFHALQQLVYGPDIAPLSRVDKFLSALKTVAREQGGVAKLAVAKLDQAVRRTAAEAGPEVIKALEDGRAETKNRVRVQELSAAIFGKKGGTENASAFGSVVGPHDTTSQMITRVLSETPAVRPALARAVIEQVFDDLLIQGQSLTPGRVTAAARRWASIGPETKAKLFDTATVRQLDDYFRQASRQAMDPSAPKLTGGAVDAFDALIAPRDTNVEKLRALAKIDPDVPKKLGRAWLEAQLDLATEQAGKFTHGAKLLASYNRIGPATKRLLFGDNVRNLDNFFRLAADVNFPGNTSATAYTLVQHGKVMLMITNPLTGIPIAIGQELGGAAIAKMLWNTPSANAIVKAMKTPKSAKAASSSSAAKVLNFARAEGVLSREQISMPKAADSDQQRQPNNVVTPPPPGPTQAGPIEVRPQ